MPAGMPTCGGNRNIYVESSKQSLVRHAKGNGRGTDEGARSRTAGPAVGLTVVRVVPYLEVCATLTPSSTSAKTARAVSASCKRP